MAKKKLTHQSNDSQNPNPHPKNQTSTPNQSSMEHSNEKLQSLDSSNQKIQSLDSSKEVSNEKIQSLDSSKEDSKEKLQNLKSLNSMLLKETIERRQQVQSLVQAKEGLENELKRFIDVNVELENRFGKVGDEKLSLEIEKALFTVFIENIVTEIGGGFGGLVREKESLIAQLKSEVSELMVSVESERDRLSQVCRERDVLNSEIDSLISEANGLKKRVVEMEKKEGKNFLEVEKLNKRYELLIKEKNEREREIEKVKSSRDLAEKNLLERVKEIQGLKAEIEGILNKKREIEEEKKEQSVKISDLEREVLKLNEIASSSKKEGEVLRKKLFELETSSSEAFENLKAMEMEIDGLVKEKRENEKVIERLNAEKDSSEQYVKSINTEMKDKNESIEKLLREKKEIEEVKANKESELLELRKALDKVRNTVLAMEESIESHKDKNAKLALEISQLTEVIEKAVLERDSAQKALDEEKNNRLNLEAKISEMEKQIEESAKQFADMKSNYENLIAEKKEIDYQFELLKKQSDGGQKVLQEAQCEISDLRSKMESVANNSERALTMLKNTVAFVCESINGKEESVASETNPDNEIKAYATELEMIKCAFRSKESAVGEMKHQVELLQSYVAEANKKKSFWTMLSSAITIFAAVSLAYVSRVR